MVATKTKILPATRCHGPSWAGEVVARMEVNKRSVRDTPRVDCWADLPVMTHLPLLPRWLGERTPFKRIYLSSGTSGTPKRIPFSDRDWREMVACRADCLTALGIDHTSRAVVVTPFSPWFSGDNLSEALTTIGASVFAAGAYRPHLSSALAILHKLASDTLITLPSTAMTLLGILEEGRVMGVLPPRSPLRRVILVGEQASEKLRATLENQWGVTTHMLFAASEAVIGHEDPVHPGSYRWNRQWVHLEVKRDDGSIHESGEGELLVSRRWSEASPVVRYALGDRVVMRPATTDRPEHFIHLYRQGQACQLPAGVTIDFPLLERFLESLRPSTTTLGVQAIHHEGGYTNLVLTVNHIPDGHSLDSLAEHFTGFSMDIADVIASGFVTLRITLDPTLGTAGGKAIQVRETGSW
ncbi:MAG: hypothetical protein HQL77_15395 [Magnetococcales bacterium]|nr:hypothetical protein [Magnetococcales bacterium]